MAQTQRAQGPSEPDAQGGGTAETPETFGVGGLVGDGRYRLTHRLGRGGMAEVFAAEDVRLGRTVAVKLLRADLAEDPVSKARFTREAQSVAGLNHHAVVAVYDSGEDTLPGGGYGSAGATVPYIVMELVQGRTIRDLLLNSEAPPPDQALIIVSGVLEALAYSHQHGIVHRDIKPANVIITDSGAVKVMDFGIARALHGAQSTMTQTGMVMGTPQYLSPEQALGKAVDHRSDLYATGCLLYELLAQRPPFTGETPLSVVYQHVQDDAVPPSQVVQSAPPELDGLVMRSLAKEPDDRFQSAGEMRGLVQYALSMLSEKGGFTGGLWDTGPVSHGGGSTPAMGVPRTAALQHPTQGDTQTALRTGAQTQVGAGVPLLPGAREDDGGFDGGGPGDGKGRGLGGRGKMWLFAALALVAIIVGIVIALDNTGGNPPPDHKDTPHSAAPKKPEHKPSRTADEQTTQGTEPGSSVGGQDQATPSKTPSEKPTRATPSKTPSQKPTDDKSQSPGNGGSQGGGQSDEPQPTSSPTDDGNNSGGPTDGGTPGPLKQP